MARPFRRVAWSALALVATACDPVVDAWGSFFPAWIVCIAIGVALSFVAHRIFVAARLDAHLGPPFLIYSCLGLLFTLASWLVLYRT
jgi:hypothetical protein